MKKSYFILLTLVITLFTSCDDWLTVEPKDMVTVDKALDTPSGYTAALIGVYQILQDVYQPDEFTMETGVDCLANIYIEPNTTTASSALNSGYNYEFDDSDFDTNSGSAFLTMYEAIANLNAIIEKLETKDVLTGEEKWMIEGEAKALRAFIHFDLWRIYGTVPDDAANAGDETILPYCTEISTNFTTYYSYSDYFNLLLEDLEEAKDLLVKSDPIVTYSNDELNDEGSIDEYVDLGWYNRQNRMNYYAVLGTLARVELWMGNKEAAYSYAKEVIDATNEDGSLKFGLGTSTDLGDGDYALFTEQLFGIETSGYDDDDYSTYSAICVNTKSVLKSVYPSTSDIRYKYLIKTLTNNMLTANAQISYKYSNMSEDDTGYKSFPVIRLSEMYLIVIESASSLSEAQEYYDTFANSRYDKNFTLTESNIQDAVINQYTREFWAEGQIFYAYKRLNLDELPLSGQNMTSDKYRVTLPTGETTVNL